MEEPVPGEPGFTEPNPGEEPFIAIVPEERESVYVAPEDVLETVDTDGDGLVDMAIIDADGNDIPDVVIDTTGDGQMDTLLVDVEADEMGDLYVAEVQDVDGAYVVTEEGDTFSLNNMETTMDGAVLSEEWDDVDPEENFDTEIGWEDNSLDMDNSLDLGNC